MTNTVAINIPELTSVCYNLEDAFYMSKDYGGAYRARMHANLAMNGSPGWEDGLAAWPGWSPPLTELLLADYLVVDVTKPYVADSFFEIEQATLMDTPTKRVVAGR